MVAYWRQAGLRYRLAAAAASRDSLAIAGTAGGEGLAGRAGGVAAVPLEGAEGPSGGV